MYNFLDDPFFRLCNVCMIKVSCYSRWPGGVSQRQRGVHLPQPAEGVRQVPDGVHH
jgi:hypothetical protein